MRLRTLVFAVYIGCCMACATTALASQTSSQKSSKPPIKSTVLSGCVSADAAAPRQFTFTDAKDGSRYRLTGTDVAKYLGRRIQIVGNVDNRRLRIAGGLTPTPNAAAQAGAIDPARAAVAAAGGGTTGTGTPELPDFKVTRVSALAGECPK